MKTLLLLGWRITWKALALSIFLFVMALLATLWLLFTHSGSQFVLERALALTPVSVKYQSWQGNLYGGWQFNNLEIVDTANQQTWVRCQSCSADWQLWPLLRAQFDIDVLRLKGLSIYVPKTDDDKKASTPANLFHFPNVYIPLTISAFDIQLDDFGIYSEQGALFNVSKSRLALEASGYDVTLKVESFFSPQVDKIILSEGAYNLSGQVMAQVREPLSFDAALGLNPVSEATDRAVDQGIDLSSIGQCTGGEAIECSGSIGARHFYWPSNPEYRLEQAKGHWRWQGDKITGALKSDISLAALLDYIGQSTNQAVSQTKNQTTNQASSQTQNYGQAIEQNQRLTIDTHLTVDLTQSQLSFQHLNLEHIDQKKPEAKIMLPGSINWLDGVHIQFPASWKNLSQKQLQWLLPDYKDLSFSLSGSSQFSYRLARSTPEKGNTQEAALQEIALNLVSDTLQIDGRGGVLWRDSDATGQTLIVDGLSLQSTHQATYESLQRTTGQSSQRATGQSSDQSAQKNTEQSTEQFTEQALQKTAEQSLKDGLTLSGKLSDNFINALDFKAKINDLSAYQGIFPQLPRGDINIHIAGNDKHLKAQANSQRLVVVSRADASLSVPIKDMANEDVAIDGAVIKDVVIEETQLLVDIAPSGSWDLTGWKLSSAALTSQLLHPDLASEPMDLNAEVSGTLAQHKIAVGLSTEINETDAVFDALAVSVAGGLNQANTAWQGDLTRALIDPNMTHAWTLQQPVPLNLSIERQVFSELCLEPERYGVLDRAFQDDGQGSDQGSIKTTGQAKGGPSAAQITSLCLAAGELSQGRGPLSLQLNNLYASREKTVFPHWWQSLDDDLQLTGAINIAASMNLIDWQLSEIDIQLSDQQLALAMIDREHQQNDETTATRVLNYQFSPVQLSLKADAKQLSWQGDIEALNQFNTDGMAWAGRLSTVGKINAVAGSVSSEAPIGPELWANASGIHAELKLDWPDLRSVEGLLSEVSDFSGRARALITMDGTVAQPNMTGNIELDQLTALVQQTGTRLANWRLLVEGTPEQFTAEAQGFVGSEDDSMNVSSDSNSQSKSEALEVPIIDDIEAVAQSSANSVGSAIANWRPRFLGRGGLFGSKSKSDNKLSSPQSPENGTEQFAANTRITGEALLQGPQRRVTLEAQGKNIIFSDTPNLQLLGDLDFKLLGEGQGRGAEKIDVSGGLTLRDSYAELTELPESAVRKSDDEIIVSHKEKKIAQPSVKTQADLRVVLSDNVRFKGFGLNALLSGDVRIRQDIQGRRSANGQLNIEEGNYRTFNQRLQISDGQLVFTGDMENPQLRLRAQKQFPQALVGVQLSGTAEQPESTLFSEPYLSEADRLSYLLTGKPVASAGDALTGDLQAAALNTGLQALRGNNSQLEERLRITDIAVESDIDNSAALALGSQINEKLYVKYLYGLVNQTARFVLEYRFNKHFSLETSTGESQAVDAYYRWQSQPPEAANREPAETH